MISCFVKPRDLIISISIFFNIQFHSTIYELKFTNFIDSQTSSQHFFCLCQSSCFCWHKSTAPDEGDSREQHMHLILLLPARSFASSSGSFFPTAPITFVALDDKIWLPQIHQSPENLQQLHTMNANFIPFYKMFLSRLVHLLDFISNQCLSN